MFFRRYRYYRMRAYSRFESIVLAYAGAIVLICAVIGFLGGILIPVSK